MSRIEGNFAYQANFQKGIYDREKPESRRAEPKAVEKEKTAGLTSSKQPELSQGAKDLLSEMQKKYSDMDFFVADYSSDEEAQKYLSRGSKDYSVLIEPELLERMASDESIKEKYLGVIDEAKNKISEIKDEIAKSDNSENGEKKSDIKSIGFSVKVDGSLSFFAELEKSSAAQKKRIEQSRDEKRTQKKEEEREARAKKRKGHQEEKIKHSLVRGDSVDELVKNIQSFEWDKIAEEIRPKSGGRLDIAT